MIKVIGCAGTAIMREMGEASVDWLNLVLAGWSHVAGSRVVGDRDWNADMAVTNVQGEVQAPWWKADVSIDGDSTDSHVKWQGMDALRVDLHTG